MSFRSAPTPPHVGPHIGYAAALEQFRPADVLEFSACAEQHGAPIEKIPALFTPFDEGAREAGRCERIDVFSHDLLPELRR